MVILSRILLGVASSSSVAALAYFGEHVPPSRRTQVMAWNFGFMRATAPLAPLFNLIAVQLPEINIGGLELQRYTYAGVITAILNFLALVVLCCCFREPPRVKSEVAGEEASLSFGVVWNTVVRTGAYTSYFLSFQNNWGNQVIMWTLPIITQRRYGTGVVGDSLILAAGGVTGLVTAFTIGECANPKYKPIDEEVVKEVTCDL